MIADIRLRKFDMKTLRQTDGNEMRLAWAELLAEDIHM